MPKFVVYEVWTQARVIEAADYHDAIRKGEPEPLDGMNLCNWHAVPADGSPIPGEADNGTGALNYQQVTDDDMA